MSNYNWIDNPTENGIAICDTDVLNECLMHLKYNNQKNKSMPYSLNSGNINSAGNSDIFDFDAPTEAVLNVSGVYTIRITNSGYYAITLVGGGGASASGLNSFGYGSYCGGGSGAAFVGEVYLSVGSHNLSVGGEGGNSVLYDENGNVLITAGGGTNGAMTNYNLDRAGGYGGVLTIVSGVQTQNVTVQTNGLDGGFGNANNPQSGGASVYNGYGKGADSPSENRTDGYFSIVLPSSSSNISYKVGGAYPSLTGTLADGKQFTLNGLNSDDITGLADGSYIKYVGSDGSSDLLKGNLTVAKTVPLLPSDNDVWINNSVSPLSVKKYISQNYTVSGTPTITSDGIVSGFSGSNYLSLQNIISGQSTFKAVIECTTSSEFIQYTSSFQSLFTIKGSNALALAYDSTQTTPRFRLYMSSNGTSWDIASDIKCNAPVDTNVFVELEKTAENYIIRTYTEDRTLIDTQTIASTAIIYNAGSNNDILIGVNRSLENREYWLGSVDLKQIKIYVGGDLVYQPNYPNGWVDYDKVPVGKITLSSGGITAVKTFPYNIDYVGNNIIETYQNGTNWYRIYADGWCEQGGCGENLTLNTTIYLLKEYKDTNYFIGGVGFVISGVGRQLVSAKTTSSFTTSSDIQNSGTDSWWTAGYIY